ncbi:metal-dependent hydrolase [Alcaligenaceae bacterium CGII-47]|nr:metal-dependent hydrolase [Alcaligenaceae bacterium CGII-47]
MDSITHAVMGASLFGSLMGRAQGRKAYLAGAALATIPDLDVFIRYANPVATIVNHRGFSHSLFVLTMLAALLAWMMRRWWPSPNYDPGRLFLALWLTLITHPLLDAFTSYGTQLLWPLDPVPTSWSTLFIIDPFYTLPLLIACVVGLIWGATPRNLRMARWALGISATYLAVSIGVKAIIEDRVQTQLADQGITAQAMFSTPEPFSILLWRVVARIDDVHTIEAITGVFDGRAAETLRQPLNTALLPDPSALPWAARLQWFTGGWLRYDEIDGQLIATDLRMGLAAGYYSFRFRLAQRDAQGKWEAVVPTRWPTTRGLEALPPTLRRIWNPTPPLPLAVWAQKMSAGSARYNSDSPALDADHVPPAPTGSQ